MVERQTSWRKGKKLKSQTKRQTLEYQEFCSLTFPEPPRLCLHSTAALDALETPRKKRIEKSSLGRKSYGKVK